MSLKVIFASVFFFLCVSLNAQVDFTAQDLQSSKSTKESIVDLSIYPNPTTDFFLIKNDQKIEQVVLYNWVGKRIESYTHYKGRIYNVENLDKGMYIIRLYNTNNKVVKALRLHRN